MYRSIGDSLGEFFGSPSFYSVPAHLRGVAEPFLERLFSDIPVGLTRDQLRRSFEQTLRSMDSASEIKRELAEIVVSFFSYLEGTGLHESAGEWGVWGEELLQEFGERIREDGSVRGETVTVAKRPGRNDLCPCKSGKKFKNCCQTLYDLGLGDTLFQ